jgi:hypothetical protein
MKKDFECTDSIKIKTQPQKTAAGTQHILVFQQNGSGEKKIEGIRRYGDDRISLDIIFINDSLPTIIDDTTPYIPRDFQADLVLDYLTHPDLSYDLAIVCRDKNIPVVASGKKLRVKGALTPLT